MEKLTQLDFAALRSIDGGADVYDRSIAMLLREIKEKAPHLLKITKPKNPPHGAEQQPYFGATLTKAGHEALKG